MREIEEGTNDDKCQVKVEMATATITTATALQQNDLLILEEKSIESSVVVESDCKQDKCNEPQQTIIETNVDSGNGGENCLLSGSSSSSTSSESGVVVVTAENKSSSSSVSVDGVVVVVETLTQTATTTTTTTTLDAAAVASTSQESDDNEEDIDTSSKEVNVDGRVNDDNDETSASSNEEATASKPIQFTQPLASTTTTTRAQLDNDDHIDMAYFKPASLRNHELTAVDEFLRVQNWSSSDAKCWNIAVKFLMARKFDVDRAIKLYAEHDHLRKKEGLDWINLNDEEFNRDLETGKFTILPFIKNYPVCALFTVRLHNSSSAGSSTQSELTTLKTLIYQLDAALENPDAQRNGINFIYDMNNCKRSNYDLALSQKILTLVRGSYPARLNKLFVVAAPFWFKCVVKVLFVTNEELKNQVPPEILPDYLGGHVKLNHKAWLLECSKLVTNKASTCSYYYHFTSSSSLSSSSSSSKQQPPSQQQQQPQQQQQQQQNSEQVTSSSSMSTTSTTTTTSTESSSSSSSSSLTASTTQTTRKRQSSDFIDNIDEQSKKNTKKQVPVVHENGRLNGQMIIEKIEPLPFDQQIFYESIQNVDPENPNGLTIDQLLQHLITTGAGGLSEEFRIIRSQPILSSYDVFKRRENMFKNRYRDVICLDESRVYLSSSSSSSPFSTKSETNKSEHGHNDEEPVEEENDDDYIHANYVDGYKHRRAYISTQGPLDETVEDFWRMIWQQCVLVIAMTTKCFEQRKLKCAQYWPLDKGERILIGSGGGGVGGDEAASFEIANVDVVDLEDYRVSKLEVRHVATNKKRLISHCQFLSWPDHGVPKSAAQILDFIDLVRANQVERLADLGGGGGNGGDDCSDNWRGHPMGPPVCVHCSAGIGRTGTFCAIEISVRRLIDCGHVNIMDTVAKIRAQRAQSVQMRDQYVFVYLAVVEYAQRERLLTGDNANVDLTKLFESLF